MFLFISGVIIFYWHVSYLLNFDTVDMASFATKYFLHSQGQCGNLMAKGTIKSCIQTQSNEFHKSNSLKI